jgi:D-alanine-D-alanine ligase
VLVEEFCTGPEFTVGILGEGAHARILGVMEIVPRRGPTEAFVYSVEVKRNFRAEVEYHVPPRRPESLVRAVETTALAAALALAAATSAASTSASARTASRGSSRRTRCPASRPGPATS